MYFFGLFVSYDPSSDGEYSSSSIFFFNLTPQRPGGGRDDSPPAGGKDDSGIAFLLTKIKYKNFTLLGVQNYFLKRCQLVPPATRQTVTSLCVATFVARRRFAETSAALWGGPFMRECVMSSLCPNAI